MSDDLKLIISENIKYYRELHNETSTMLAEALGYSQSAVSGWENGNKMPRAEAIEKLAHHFGVQKSNLLNKNHTTDSDFTIDLSLDNTFTYQGKPISKEQMDLIKSMLHQFTKDDDN